MTWLATLRGITQGGTRRIGPGWLVLVVGPSGAGKDTLIDHARIACRANSEVVFPRRVITRKACAAEDHETMCHEAFDQAVRDGRFALSWEAHGLKYGIPAAIDHELRAGRSVVCNVSRAIVATARQRYLCVLTVLVTAPTDILAARLAARKRASDGSIAQRIGRAPVSTDELRPDFVISNVGDPQTAAAKLVAIATARNFIIAL
jgi:ribose 1,5-bisphosphokinase